MRRLEQPRIVRLRERQRELAERLRSLLDSTGVAAAD